MMLQNTTHARIAGIPLPAPCRSTPRHSTGGRELQKAFRRVPTYFCAKLGLTVGTDEKYHHAAGLGTLVAPGVTGSVLYDRVSRPKVYLLAVV